MESDPLRQTFLVLRTQAGDEKAFEELFRRFGERTHRYLVSLLGSAAADDVQQEVWLGVYRRIASLANPAGFRTWLFQITRHRAIDHLRHARREQALLAGAAARLDPAELVADEAFELSIDEEMISSAMEKLSPQHREVLLLRFWEDLSYPEMALVIGAPVGTVRSRLFHGKRLLREQLEDRRQPLAFTLNRTEETHHERES